MNTLPNDPRAALGLRPIINVSGTMTGLGASIAQPEVIEAMRAILPHFVEIDALQRLASRRIAQSTGAEAGYVTASSAAGITLAVAAAMTGPDLALIEQLPDNTGMRSEVLLQMGHAVHYGAPIEQGIRLAGSRVRLVGTATLASDYQLAAAINEHTAAAVYVVSHHVVDYGQIALQRFAEICHARKVPVIVDAASEYDLRRFIDQGADIVIYSGHKFLGGCTSGIVAGRRDFVRSMFLQNRGIGRGFKVGKESIAGTIAALQAWEVRDHAAVRAREDATLSEWQSALAEVAGIHTTVVPDPTNNPLSRLEIRVDAGATCISAWDLADRLARHDPPIIVRDHEVESGHFFLDPCNLHFGQAAVVADAIRGICMQAQKHPDAGRSIAERNADKIRSMMDWP